MTAKRGFFGKMSANVVLFSLCMVALASATFYYPKPKPVYYKPKPPVYKPKPKPKPGCRKVTGIIFVCTQCMYVWFIIVLTATNFLLSQDTYVDVSEWRSVLVSSQMCQPFT